MPEALQQAIAHHRAGNLAAAEQIYRQLLPTEGRNPQLLHMLGILLTQTRRAHEAIPHLRNAAMIAPQAASVQFSLAQAFRFCGQTPEALAAAQRSIQLNPNYAPAHNELGMALAHGGRLAEAVLAWRRAVQLDPNFCDAHTNLGAALAQLNQIGAAIAPLERAVEINPNSAVAHNNLAAAYDSAGRTADSIAHLRRAIELHPTFFDALRNLAKLLVEEGADEEALGFISRAIAVNPNDPHARFLRSLMHLNLGRLREGFAEYEYRKLGTDFDIHGRAFAKPKWDGGDLTGKRIVLHSEQGLGDTIQFVRYAPLLAERGATVIVESPSELRDLLQTVPGVSTVVARGDPLPAFDIHASVVSLPLLFGTDSATVPANVPYVFADAQRAAHWARRIPHEAGKLRIGLVFTGNPAQSNNARRSVPVAEFSALASVPNVTWFSLQKSHKVTEDVWAASKLAVIDFTENLNNFADTAALIAQLDLVISVCTSVTHLAGAMGKPVWTLLSHVADWRWLKDRSDSPWYPTMRLFRQPARGDWQSLLRQIAFELSRSAPTI